jgi:hypothetical protein
LHTHEKDEREFFDRSSTHHQPIITHRRKQRRFCAAFPLKENLMGFHRCHDFDAEEGSINYGI